MPPFRLFWVLSMDFNLQSRCSNSERLFWFYPFVYHPTSHQTPITSSNLSRDTHKVNYGSLYYRFLPQSPVYPLVPTKKSLLLHLHPCLLDPRKDNGLLLSYSSGSYLSLTSCRSEQQESPLFLTLSKTVYPIDTCVTLTRGLRHPDAST